MHCDDIRRLLPFARPGPGELDGADRAALDAHLADCPDCGPLARAEANADAAIGLAVRDVPVPAAFRGRLDRALDAARYAWWRLRLLGAGAACVAALLAAGAAYRLTRPTLDAYAVAQATYEQMGHWRTAEDARQTADDWLRGQDRRLAAPADFDYRNLAFVGRADFGGLTGVPTLTLVRGDATARVHFVRAAAFRGLGGADEQPVESGNCTVAVRRYEELPGWLVIVVTGGKSVDWFLRKIDPAAPA
jgi:hypothetical protein